MSANANCLFIQFAKRPIAGQVKTRLIPAIGEDAATQVHLALMTQTLESLASANLGSVELWLDSMPGPTDHYPPKFYELIAACQRAQVALRVQTGADLGERMYQALAAGLGEYRRVVLVGSDCPVLDTHYLREALEILDEGEDVVFGPAEDGGFVLVAARKAHPKMFANVLWSDPTTLHLALQACTRVDLATACLAKRWDVDEIADLERWQALLKAPRR